MCEDTSHRLQNDVGRVVAAVVATIKRVWLDGEQTKSAWLFDLRVDEDYQVATRPPFALCVPTAFAAKTLPFALCVPTAFAAKTLPFALCVPTAFAAVSLRTASGKGSRRRSPPSSSAGCPSATWTCCEAAGTAYSCNPYGEPLLQL